LSHIWAQSSSIEGEADDETGADYLTQYPSLSIEIAFWTRFETRMPCVSTYT
ncbi:unnamed protein product, partial [marine sediment metagenome]